MLAARAADLPARLVEADPGNAAYARRLAAAGGLTAVEVVVGDRRHAEATSGPSRPTWCSCGVFGNLGEDDVRRTVEYLPMLYAPAATVTWTRSQRAPDFTGEIRGWFAAAGFVEVAFSAPQDVLWSVGVHRLAVDPAPLETSARLLTFIPLRPS